MEVEGREVSDRRDSLEAQIVRQVHFDVVDGRVDPLYEYGSMRVAQTSIVGHVLALHGICRGQLRGTGLALLT